MAPWKPGTPAGRRPRAATRRGAALAAALAIALAAAAGCSAAPASSGAGTAAGPLPAATARQVFERYVAAAAASPKPASALLRLVTGVEQAVLGATLARHSVTQGSGSTSGAYRSTLTVRPGYTAYSYGPPAFYLPEAAGYPRFFVASVTRTLRAASGSAGQAATMPGGVRLPASGPVLMLFSQAGQGAPWLLASISRLPAGTAVPPLAKDASGRIPVASLSAAALAARPADVGPLQAAVADDGPASTAMRAVTAGPLTTGLYRDQASHASGLRPPRGDVCQWALEGAGYPEFALRTAGGGALVFYPMTLATTVAVPGFIDKASPVHSGAPIQVPPDVQMLLPRGQRAPLVQLQAQQTLSFVAVDPPQGAGKVQVIAIGGGLTSASAS